MVMTTKSPGNHKKLALFIICVLIVALISPRFNFSPATFQTEVVYNPLTILSETFCSVPLVHFHINLLFNFHSSSLDNHKISSPTPSLSASCKNKLVTDWTYQQEEIGSRWLMCRYTISKDFAFIFCLVVTVWVSNVCIWTS